MIQILTALLGVFISAIFSLFVFTILPADFQNAPTMYALTLLFTVLGGAIGCLVGEHVEYKSMERYLENIEPRVTINKLRNKNGESKK